MYEEREKDRWSMEREKDRWSMEREKDRWSMEREKDRRSMEREKDRCIDIDVWRERYVWRESEREREMYGEK